MSVRNALLVPVLAVWCLGCNGEESAAKDPPEQVVKKPSQGVTAASPSETWNEIEATCAKAESGLKGVMDAFGFKRDERLEEHPTEASSYSRVYSSATADGTKVLEAIRKVAIGFAEDDDGDGSVSFSYELPYFDDIADHNMDIVVSVSVSLDGAETYERTGEKFVAISLVHALILPEYTLPNGPADQKTEQWDDGPDRWTLCTMDTQGNAIDAPALEASLVERGFKLQEGQKPWKVYHKGKFDVAICLPSEYRIEGPVGRQHPVPVMAPAQTQAQQRPILLLKVSE